MTQDSAANAPTPEAAAATSKAGGKRIQVRKSGVHGKGVFSVAPLKKGEVLIEYKGEVITWKEALRRHPHDPKDPDHTFYFHVDDKHVIDAKYGGNAARWINHACTPNCEADEIDGRIFIKALRKIEPGTELFYDYGLVIDEPYTPKLKKQFECRCGTKGCRGTMLAPKDEAEGKPKKKKKKSKDKAKAESKATGKADARSDTPSDHKANGKAKGKPKSQSKH